MSQIPLFKVFMHDDIVQPTIDTLTSGFVTQGPRVEEFEQKLSEFIGNENILTLNSATAGLTLALRLLKNQDEEWCGIEDDDEVLTPALTCFATTSSILANNLNIKWVDVDPNTSNVSLDDIRSKLSPKTKVIMVVHWGGYPVDLDGLKDIQEECYEKFGFKPWIVEDCAHAFGAEYKGQKLGCHGNLCVFSFQAIKHLTTGDGGMIVLPNKSLYDRCKLLRWYGIDRDKRNYNKKDLRLENDIVDSGFKFHMNDINATIGLHNLPHMNDLLQKCRDNGQYYHDNLSNVEGVRLLENNNDRKSAYWLFTMFVDRKEDFINCMKEKGVFVSQVHQRNDINSCVKQFEEELPNLDEFQKGLVCIPVGWWVSEEDREYIVNCIREW